MHHHLSHLRWPPYHKISTISPRSDLSISPSSLFSKIVMPQSCRANGVSSFSTFHVPALNLFQVKPSDSEKMAHPGTLCGFVCWLGHIELPFICAKDERSTRGVETPGANGGSNLQGVSNKIIFNPARQVPADPDACFFSFSSS